jgi:putative membrane protein insertion efficiency factor
MLNPTKSMTTLPARAASGLVWVYQRTVSPALVVLNPTCGCRFAPTCSHYARGALAEHGLVIGLYLTIRRLAKCGPWHPGGEDPVPSSPGRRRASPPLVCRSVRKAG